jgi:hypothetical protein
MSFENDAPLYDGLAQPTGDMNTPIALAAGVVAALVAGGLWALLVLSTGYELGYAAWGVGLLVGGAMSRVTANRSRQLAMAAATFALLGLVLGKAFIFLGSTDAVARELAGDDQWLTGTVAWQMFEARELDAATLDELDATVAAGDTLSDAVWEAMTAQAATRLAGFSADEREALGRQIAGSVMAQIGVVRGVAGQVTPFDLLWIFLAVGSAWGMLAPRKEEESAVEAGQV